MLSSLVESDHHLSEYIYILCLHARSLEVILFPAHTEVQYTGDQGEGGGAYSHPVAPAEQQNGVRLPGLGRQNFGLVVQVSLGSKQRNGHSQQENYKEENIVQ